MGAEIPGAGVGVPESWFFARTVMFKRTYDSVGVIERYCVEKARLSFNGVNINTITFLVLNIE
jgi:hypothetical protein